MADPFYEPLPGMGQAPWSLNGAIQEIRERIGNVDDFIDGPGIESAIAEVAATLNPEALSDAFIANRVNDLESSTRAAINDAVGRIPVESLGAAGNGVTDDTSALQQAVSSGKPVKLRAGATYRVTSALNAGAICDIDATGATLLVDHGADAIRRFASVSDVTPVASVSAISATNAPSGAPNLNYDIAVSTSVPTSWAPGDLIALGADDVIPGSRDQGGSSTTQNRTGAFLRIVSISPGVIRATGKIDDPLTTNIRVGKLASDEVFSWRGGTIVYSTSAKSGSGYTFFLSNVVAPKISDVTIPWVKSGAFHIRGCVYWSVDNVRVYRGANNLSIPAFGYGVLNIGSCYGVLRNSVFSDLRHAYTNGGNFIEAGRTDLGYNGRPSDNIIVDCIGESCSGTPFDSHTQGIREVFRNCVAKNSDVGFSLRGLYHTVTGCVSISCRAAVVVFCEGVGGRSYGHVIDGITIYGAANVVEFNVNKVSGSTSLDTKDEVFSVVRNVVSLNQTGRTAIVRNTRVIMENFSILWGPERTNSLGILVNNAHVYARNHTVRMADPSQLADFYIGFTVDGIASPSSEAEFENIRILGNGPASFNYFVAGTPGSFFRGSNVRMTAAPAVAVKQSSYPLPTATDLNFS